MTDDEVLRLFDERHRLYKSWRTDDHHALELQAAEYERRLADLNHEHARAQETAQTYVTIEKYEDAVKAEAAAREAALAHKDEQIQLLAIDVSDLKNFKSKALGIAAVAAPLLLLAGGVLGKAFGG